MIRRHTIALIVTLIIAAAPMALAEEIKVTGYIPAPRGIFDQLQTNILWDYADGSLHTPLSFSNDWYVDPSGTPVSAPGSDVDGKLMSARLKGVLHASRFEDVDNVAWFLDPATPMTGTALAVNGRLGIGTATPANPLSVIGTVPGQYTAVFQGSDKFGVAVGHGTYVINTGVIQGLGPGGSANLAINAGGGNVGIGMALPQAQLVVLGNSAPPRGATGSAGHPADAQAQTTRDYSGRDYWVNSINKWVSEISDNSNSNGPNDWRLVHKVGGVWQDMYNLNPRTVGVGTGSGMNTSYKFHVNGKTWLQGNTQVNGVLTINGPPGELLDVGGAARVNGPLSTGNITLNGNLDAGGYLSGSSIAPNPTQCQWVSFGRCPGNKLIMQINFNTKQYECCRPTD